MSENTPTLNKDDLKGMSEEQILALPMSAIEDAKQFQTFPAGAFTFTVKNPRIGTIERGDNSFRGAIMDLTMISCLELFDKSGAVEEPAVDTEFEVTSSLDEFLQYFATAWRPIATELGVADQPLPVWLEKFNNITISAVISHTKDKNGKKTAKGDDVYYARLNEPTLL